MVIELLDIRKPANPALLWMLVNDLKRDIEDSDLHFYLGAEQLFVLEYV